MPNDHAVIDLPIKELKQDWPRSTPPESEVIDLPIKELKPGLSGPVRGRLAVIDLPIKELKLRTNNAKPPAETLLIYLLRN